MGEIPVAWRLLTHQQPDLYAVAFPEQGVQDCGWLLRLICIGCVPRYAAGYPQPAVVEHRLELCPLQTAHECGILRPDFKERCLKGLIFVRLLNMS